MLASMAGRAHAEANFAARMRAGGPATEAKSPAWGDPSSACSQGVHGARGVRVRAVPVGGGGRAAEQCAPCEGVNGSGSAEVARRWRDARGAPHEEARRWERGECEVPRTARGRRRSAEAGDAARRLEAKRRPEAKRGGWRRSARLETQRGGRRRSAVLPTHRFSPDRGPRQRRSASGLGALRESRPRWTRRATAHVGARFARPRAPLLSGITGPCQGKDNLLAALSPMS